MIVVLLSGEGAVSTGQAEDEVRGAGKAINSSVCILPPMYCGERRRRQQIPTGCLLRRRPRGDLGSHALQVAPLSSNEG